MCPRLGHREQRLADVRASLVWDLGIALKTQLRSPQYLNHMVEQDPFNLGQLRLAVQASIENPRPH